MTYLTSPEMVGMQVEFPFLNTILLFHLNCNTFILTFSLFLMGLDTTSARQVDETHGPDKYLKIKANMKIVEILQVYTAINISIRRYCKVISEVTFSFVSTFWLRFQIQSLNLIRFRVFHQGV